MADERFICKTCKLFEKRNDFEGICHRYPPQEGKVQPRVLDSNFCGEWRHE